MVFIVSFAFAVTACAKTQPTSAKTSVAPVKALAKSAKAKVPLALGVEGTLPTLTYLDPKTGKLLWKAHAKSIGAQSGVVSSNVTVTMQSVSGILYQNGAPADNIAADTVRGDQSNKIVTANGNVHLISVANPGTTIQCDKLIWNAGNNILLGTGHVIFKKGGFTQTAPSFQADTKMKMLTMPAPGMGGGKGNTTILNTPL